MTWDFNLSIAYMHLKSAAEATAGQVQGDAASSTENFDFRSMALKMHITHLRGRRVRQRRHCETANLMGDAPPSRFRLRFEWRLKSR